MSLETTTKQLKAAFSSQDYKKCLSLLPKVKVQLAQHGLLVPIITPSTNQGDLLILRLILEIGALSAINLLDLTQFEKYLTALRPFYSLTTPFFSQNKSPSENKLVALYLLLLLTKGDISQFHIELLALAGAAEDMSVIENDPYLNYPVKLERWLMEGSYDKVWGMINEAKAGSDFAEFVFFNESLTDTLRSEIAKCLAVSYKSLPVSNAKNLLFFSDEKAVLEFVRNECQGCTIQNGTIFFPQEEEHVEDSVSETLIRNVLGYATEMEAIV